MPGKAWTSDLPTKGVSSPSTWPYWISVPEARALAAASVKPEAKTERRCNRPRSSSPSSPQLHSIEASNVLWRGGPGALATYQEVEAVGDFLGNGPEAH